MSVVLEFDTETDISDAVYANMRRAVTRAAGLVAEHHQLPEHTCTVKFSEPQGCPSNKRRYGSQHDAEQVLKQAILSGSERRREERAYRCPDCKGWHLTSTARRDYSADGADRALKAPQHPRRAPSKHADV